MNEILAATIHTPGLHWPGFLTGFGGGVIIGMIIMAILVHRSKFF